MTGPAVSIVIPCYNDGRFLDGLLASLAAQTFRDFEIIIVNDGSNDPATLRKLDELRSVVTVIDQKNKYLPGARNTGFRQARGEFFLPVDSDDRLEPTYIAETVAALRAAPPDVGFAFTHMLLSGALAGVRRCHFSRFDQLFLNSLTYCMLFRASAWRAAGGYDETMKNGMDDWEFNIRLAAIGYRGLEIKKPLFIYAVRADGMLLTLSARVQGTGWRRIREKHKALYRLPALVAAWRDGGGGVVSALNGIVLLSMTKLLPEAWCNALFFRLLTAVRSWRMARGQIQAGPDYPKRPANP